MRCKVTDVPDEYSKFDFGFLFDNVTSLLHFSNSRNFNPIIITKNPIINKWKDILPVNTGKFIKISGEHMYTSEYLKLFRMTVGGINCPYVSFAMNLIKCKVPDMSTVSLNNDGNAAFQLGNYKMKVGEVRYPDNEGGTGTSLTGVLIYLVPGILIPSVIILSLVMFIVLRRRYNKKKKDNNRSSFQTSRMKRDEPRHGPPTDTETIPLTSIDDYLQPGSSSHLSSATPRINGSSARSSICAEYQRQVDAIINGISDPSLRESVQDLLITRNRLDMGPIIGKGHFGSVYQAALKDEKHSHSIKVAVKTITTENDSGSDNAAEQFLREGSIMKPFSHPHILSILGMCIESNGIAMVILPFMANGDLRKYVKQKDREFTARNLLRLAQQVTEGMAYLSQLKFVHRDLAARNCMIDDKLVVKVADFGLTRPSVLYEKESKPIQSKEMPIKWMSLESLESHIFTTKSDVWSFGILLWELMTRCMTPYNDLQSQDILNFLMSGHRLRQPKYCPETIYAIMKECWSLNPNDRPTFADLVNRLELMLRPPEKRRTPLSENNQVYINMLSDTEYLEPMPSASEPLINS